MNIFDRYASSGDRDLLSELAEYLEECKGKSIVPKKALSVVNRLAFAVERKGAHPAWICLWRLSDLTANCMAEKFLDGLQNHVHCKSILESCLSTLTRSPSEQRVTCLKFLAAFMAYSADRRRIVCDATGLLTHILEHTLDAIHASPVGELSFHYIPLTSYVSLARNAHTKQSAKFLPREHHFAEYFELRS
jgi:hypothetical protein